MSTEEFILKYKPRLSFIEMMKQENYVPNAYLRLDCSVNLDFYTQYVQFFMELFQSAFPSDGNRIKLLIDWRNKGHVPLNKEDTIYLIESLFLINDKKNGEIISNTNTSCNPSQKFNKTIEEKLKKYNTSRVDFKFEGSDNSLEVITVNGSPLITHPNWLNNETWPGLIIMNEINSMNIKLKCIGSGNLIIKLRAMDLKDNRGKRIPIYLNYNKFLINDEEIISDDEIIVWHDNPFIYNKKINDGEIINIVISYVPY